MIISELIWFWNFSKSLNFFWVRWIFQIYVNFSDFFWILWNFLIFFRKQDVRFWYNWWLIFLIFVLQKSFAIPSFLFCGIARNRMFYLGEISGVWLAFQSNSIFLFCGLSWWWVSAGNLTSISPTADFCCWTEFRFLMKLIILWEIQLIGRNFSPNLFFVLGFAAAERNVGLR